MSVIGKGFQDRVLTGKEINEIIEESAAGGAFDGKKVLALIPDLTRTCPVDVMFKALYEHVLPRASCLDYMIALGTHQPLSEEDICKRVGITPQEHRDNYSKVRFFNHQWDNPDQLSVVGAFDRGEISHLTDGLFELDIDVQCNKSIHDYDQLLVVGPVFPHEIVGFSGGTKYIFPGISGPDVLHFFHWLAAVVTNPKIIGVKDTPVREIVNRSAAMLPNEQKAFCVVVNKGDAAGLYFGDVNDAWSSAADLSARVHIVYTDRAYHTVVSCAPPMYNDLWVGGKAMYKMEPAIADGGSLTIVAPHINELSYSHGETIRKIGFHVRDYFLDQWDKFKDIPWGLLAHSSHVRGIGSYENGNEEPRVHVVLATSISEAECKAVNLEYTDHQSLDLDSYKNREEEGVLFVPKAGETLYRWKDAPEKLGGNGT